MLYSTDVQNPQGLNTIEGICRVRVRGGAATRGDVMECDLARTDANTTTDLPGVAESCLYNVVPVTSAGAQGRRPLVVLLEDAADDAECAAMMGGWADCKVYKSSGDIAAGDTLVAVAGARYLVPVASGNVGDRHQATASRAVTAPNPAVLSKVYFDGVYGTGGVKAS